MKTINDVMTGTTATTTPSSYSFKMAHPNVGETEKSFQFEYMYLCSVGSFFIVKEDLLKSLLIERKPTLKNPPPKDVPAGRLVVRLVC